MKLQKILLKKIFQNLKEWLYRFQQKHNLKFKTLHGESGSVNDAIWDEWIEETLHPILAEYKPYDIFNCNERSLLYRTKPPPQKKNICKKRKITWT